MGDGERKVKGRGEIWVAADLPLPEGSMLTGIPSTSASGGRDSFLLQSNSLVDLPL